MRKGIILAALLALLPGLATAKFKVKIDSDKITHGSVHVPAGQTRNADIVTSGPVTVEGTLNGDCVALGGPVTVSGEILGDLASLGGPITISGSVSGDVASLGGPVTVSGSVKGEIASMGGDVHVSSGASVLGDLALLGGKLKKADGALVTGDVVNLDLSMIKNFMPLLRYKDMNRDTDFSEKPAAWGKWLGFGASLAFLAGVGLMIVLLTAFLPKQVENVAQAIKTDFWKSAGIGLLIVLLTSPAFMLLVVSILGIPLIPLAGLLYCGAVLMGMAGFSLILSERFHGSLGKPAPTTFAGVGIGYALLISLMVIGKMIKLAGAPWGLFGGVFILTNMILISCGLLVGLGAIWTTRMGSHKSLGQIARQGL